MAAISDLNEKPILEHVTEGGRFTFYPNIAIAEASEGNHVTYKKESRILNLAEEVYGDSIPFVYISNRINSYSLDPLGYYEALKSIPNLKGYAIVSQNKRRQQLAGLEKLFIKKPIKIFDDIESAILWANQLTGKRN